MKTFTIGEARHSFLYRICTHTANAVAEELFKTTSIIAYNNFSSFHPVRHGAAIKFAKIIAELEDAIKSKSDLAKVICIDTCCNITADTLNPAKYAKGLNRDQTIKVKLGNNVSVERRKDQRLSLLTLCWEKTPKGEDRPLIILQDVEIIDS